MAVIEELQLTDQQWERARREDICPAILLEDPHALLEYPCEPMNSERDPSLFLLHFQGNEPTHYNNWALPSLRLEYVPINEGDKEGRCWMLLALLDGTQIPTALMRSDPTALWPLGFHGSSGIEHYWTPDGKSPLEQVKFSPYPTKDQVTKQSGSEPHMAEHLISRLEVRQDALTRRREALADKQSQRMMLKIDGVTELLHHVVASSQQTTHQLSELEHNQHALEEHQKACSAVVADLQRQVRELQQRVTSSTTSPLPTSQTATEPQDGSFDFADGKPAPTRSITVDGYEVAVEELTEPMPMFWWVKGQSHRAWLPPQKAVFDIDQKGFTVDLLSRPRANEPDYRAIPVRYLSFCDGKSRKRQRRHW